jgi:NADH-quinone oxidoreductase subunit E
LDTRPVGHKRVYVCTNISCSLRGGRRLLDNLSEAIGEGAGREDIQVRGFECLGACDIAPMVSVDGVFVGPVEDGEVDELARQIRDGADPLPAKQLIKRRSADPNANTREWDRPAVDFDAVESEIERPAPGSDPLPPEPSSFGPPMGVPDPPDEPVAPLEQAPSQPEEDTE